jgi:hypothetical protein
MIEIWRYSHWENIELSKVDTETTFSFTLIDTETDLNKQRSPSEVTTIIVVPRPIAELPKSPAIQSWVQQSTQRTMTTPVEPPKTPESNPTDDLVVELLVQLDPTDPRYTLSSDEKNITLIFSWESGIHARYDMHSQAITLIGGDQNMHREILTGIQVELQIIFEWEMARLVTIEKQRILTKFDPIESFLEKSFWELAYEWSDADLASALIWSRINGNSAAKFFTLPAYQPLFAIFQEKCRQVGVEVAMVRSNKWSIECTISISLRWESGISGIITTRDPLQYKNPTLNQLLDVTVAGTCINAEYSQKLTHILRLVITTMSVAGKRISDSQSGAQSTPKKNNNARNSQPILTQGDISSILAGTYKKSRQSWEALDKTSQTQIQYAINRLSKNPGEWRQFLRWGFSETTGYYACQVTWHHSWDTLLDDDMVILWDERISSVASWQQGNPYIYDMIRSNPRHQKYFILKMMATILDKPWKGKRPFTNGIKDYFDVFWKDIPEDIKQKFLEYVAWRDWKASKWLDIKLADGTWLFDNFLSGAESKKIPLRYSRPSYISVGELRSYQGEISQESDLLPEETDD